MGGNGSEGLGDDFFEQILAVPEASVGGYGRSIVGDVGSMPMVLQLGSTSDGGGENGLRGGGSLGIGVGMPLGLNLEQAGFMRHQGGDGSITNNHHHHHQQQLLCLNNNNHNGNNSNNNSTSSSSSSAGITDRDMHLRGLFSGFGQLHSTPSHTYAHAQTLRPTLLSPSPPSQPHLHHHHHHQPFQSQPPTSVPIASMPQPPGIRPRVRARRGQATDPHSIAERLRRERIAERMKALQELVPSINKTDRVVMLDEIMDYVKFLRLQVKVLSMSRLGGAGAVAQLVSDVPLSAVEGEDIEGGANQQAWDKWSTDGTEQQVAKLMEEDVGAAMQFLQSKALCVMPISLASAIFRMPQSEASSLIKPESNSHS